MEELDEREYTPTQTEDKYIDPEYFNDDPDESNLVLSLAVELKPLITPKMLPQSFYLKTEVLPLIYEALVQVEKVRPRDPIEFFAAYLLNRNKKEIV